MQVKYSFPFGRVLQIPRRSVRVIKKHLAAVGFINAEGKGPLQRSDRPARFGGDVHLVFRGVWYSLAVQGNRWIGRLDQVGEVRVHVRVVKSQRKPLGRRGPSTDFLEQQANTILRKRPSAR